MLYKYKYNVPTYRNVRNVIYIIDNLYCSLSVSYNVFDFFILKDLQYSTEFKIFVNNL
jgi:hypothetical protein